MKFENAYWRGALTLLIFLVAFDLHAQTTNVLVSDMPDWIQPSDWTAPSQAPNKQTSEGVRYVLIEHQEHPKREEDFTHIVLLMENESGVQDSGSLSFDFDPSFQQLILHQVRIHRGKEILERLDRTKIKVIQPERELNDHLFSGELSAVLFVEDLRVGDVLEYAYTVRGSNPILKGHYSERFYVTRRIPVDRQRVRVVWPSAEPLYVRQHLTEVPVRKKTANHETEYLWDFDQTPAVPYEDDVPAEYEAYGYVELSDFDNWARVVDWAAPLYAGKQTAIPAELQTLITHWQAAGTTTEEKARMALQFVQDELRYTGLELGPDSFRPADPFESFRLRYGDCKGKAALLCTILRAMKIEAYPALVNSSERESVAQRLPSAFAFDHVIVKMVLDGKTIWVDPTYSLQGGTLWNRYVPRYGKALVLKAGVSELESIPPPNEKHFLQKITSTFQLKDYNSPVSLTIKTIYYGYQADDMRGYFARTEAKEVEKNYLNFYARYYSEIHDPRPLQIKDDRDANVMEVVEQYTIPNLWESDQKNHRFEASFYADALESVLQSPDTRLRKMPLRIPYPLRREQDIVVQLPEPWDVPPSDQSVNHDAFSFHCSRRVSGKTARFHYECETKKRELPPDQVAGYLKKVDQMQDLVGDVLFRPDHQSRSSFFARINWLMVVVAGFGLAMTTAGSVWSWRATRSEFSLPPPIPVGFGERNLQGLGGWLILVGIGLCLGPISRGFLLLKNWEGFFAIDVWQMVAVPTGTKYHPLYGPLLMLELLGNVILLGLNGLAICLFFGRRKFFKKVFVTLLVTSAAFLLADELLGNQIPMVANSDSSLREFLRAAFGALIWCSYIAKSKRVRATFIR